MYRKRIKIVLNRYFSTPRKFGAFRDKIYRFWSRIAQLSDHPQKWDNTLWAEQFSIKNYQFLHKIWKIPKSIKTWKFAKKSINFDRKLLSSQTTHQNVLVLFGILRTLYFHRVQDHFGGWSVSRAICKSIQRILFSPFLDGGYFIEKCTPYKKMVNYKPWHRS